jgi:hypothetical protein
MRTITLEEHFASPGFLDGPGEDSKHKLYGFGGSAAKLFEQLCDLGDKRIAEMNRSHRYANTVAHFPGAQSSSKLLSFGVRPRNE